MTLQFAMIDSARHECECYVARNKENGSYRYVHVYEAADASWSIHLYSANCHDKERHPVTVKLHETTFNAVYEIVLDRKGIEKLRDEQIKEEESTHAC